MQETSPWTWIGPVVLIIIFIGVTVFWCLWLRIQKKETVEIINQQQRSNRQLQDYNPRAPKVFLNGDIGKSIRNSFRRLKPNSKSLKATSNGSHNPYNKFNGANGIRNEAFLNDHIHLQPVHSSPKKLWKNQDGSISSASSQRYLYRGSIDDVHTHSGDNPDPILNRNQIQRDNFEAANRPPVRAKGMPPPKYDDIPFNFNKREKHSSDEQYHQMHSRQTNPQLMNHHHISNGTSRIHHVDYQAPTDNNRYYTSRQNHHFQPVTSELSLNVSNLPYHSVQNSEGETII